LNLDLNASKYLNWNEMKTNVSWKAKKCKDRLTQIYQILNKVQKTLNSIIIIIIINSYILVTLIKSTHEKLYAIYIEWTKRSEIENHSLFIRLLHAVVDWSWQVESSRLSQVLDSSRLDLSQNSWLEYLSKVEMFNSSIQVESKSWNQVLTWNFQLNSSRHEDK